MLSVVMPVKNGMPFLRESLASIEVQSFQNFKVLLWDNGSSDGTLEEARKWIPARLPGMLISDRPLELHDCLAALVEEAESKLIARMDADDVCLPDRFQRQVHFLEQFPKTLAVGGQLDWIDQKGHPIQTGVVYPREYHEVLLAFACANPLAHPAVMFRRDAVLKVGNYQKPKPVEDIDLWMRLALKGPIRNLDKKVLQYRRHSKAVCVVAEQEARLEEAVAGAVSEHALRHWALNPETYRRLRARQVKFAAPLLLRMVRAVATRSGRGTREVLHSRQNRQILGCLVQRNDYATRAFLKLAALTGGSRAKQGWSR